MKNEILNVSHELFDRITVVKGYLVLNAERKKIDYSLLLLNEINEIESLVGSSLDRVGKQTFPQ